MADIGKAVGDVGNLFLRIVMVALVIGSILGATVFSSITIVNTTTLSASLAAFITAAIAFIAVGGTLIGVLWLMKYIKPLFAKGGLGSISS